ncbi:Beta-galactoside-binding lectin 14 kDa lectin Electrolectin [Channa argus]|uniref:Galectin n=2 Tax=Channa argus TaxID=215402 RepID=A0A6G1PVZ9_CHAAH|nr:Beta-galactoside-binding lectin 14 kDa lectin Electrolectin [Channa argus]
MTLNSTFGTGQTLTITGIPGLKATNFAVNIGPDNDDIVLHVNPRFNHYGEHKKVIFNSCEGGSWGSWIRGEEFPFFHGVEFKIVIKFTGKEFVVSFFDGSNVVFPNRIGLQQYSHITVDGDVCITSFAIV